MAVSRGKMLGRIAVLTRNGLAACRCPDCNSRGVARARKRQEAREVAREIADGIVELDREEGRAMFDACCRQYMGISGEEFLRRWDAGEIDVEDDWPTAHLSTLIPFAR